MFSFLILTHTKRKEHKFRKNEIKFKIKSRKFSHFVKTKISFGERRNMEKSPKKNENEIEIFENVMEEKKTPKSRKKN